MEYRFETRLSRSAFRAKLFITRRQTSNRVVWLACCHSSGVLKRATNSRKKSLSSYKSHEKMTHLYGFPISPGGSKNVFKLRFISSPFGVRSDELQNNCRRWVQRAPPSSSRIIWKSTFSPAGSARGSATSI